jgi:hypothetical protein
MLQYSNAVRVRTMASTKYLADGNERVAKIADFGQRSANLAGCARSIRRAGAVHRHGKPACFVSFGGESFFFPSAASARDPRARCEPEISRPKIFCRRAFIFAPFLARSLSPLISLI